MVNFDDLPVELALNILSYLPQHCLPTIAKVSARWKTLAFDPSLWTEVCIDSTFGSSVQHVRDILERATMILGLLHASRNCSSLETLQVTDVWNENEVSVAQAIQRFRKLRVVSVFDNCGTDWFDSRFRTPGEIQDFDVPRLEMQEQHLTLLAESCRETLRSIAFSAKVLTPASLNTLYGCRALESIAIHDLCGEGLVLPKLIKLPNLVRAQLHIAVETTEAIRKLNSIVDILDTSSKGSARLELRLHCSSQSSQDDMIREVSLFKEFLALNTRLSAQHIRNIEEQCWRIKHSKIFWLPIGRITSRIVDTSFPVISKTLKHLILELSD
ncbi:hypothetical protein HPB49_025326 [Dermacentor silvarum]|uniref:Uncharacterized protein n=1 Tax=Dermacentor silvarum TaxID=543639 RepID=A0ACB8CIK3_DERSI|nr:hypothetical protein HPB49_025326 [Dermacentor silvarum]